MPFEACCPGVKYPGNIFLFCCVFNSSFFVPYTYFLMIIIGDDCPPVWGQCSHALHMQCIMKWLGMLVIILYFGRYTTLYFL